MVVLQRVLLPIINAFFITSVLFYCMFLLIDIEQPTLKTKTVLPKLQWVNIPNESDLVTGIKKPAPPAKIEEQPEVPKELMSLELEHDALGGAPAYKPPKPTDITVASNSQLTLMLGQQPNYPVRELKRGTEGYVVVGFSVDAAGRVFNAFVIEAEPAGVFDKSALKAITGFKYKPHRVDGKAVSTDGQQYLFRYEMGDNKES